MSSWFQNKTVIVTGGAGGLGLVIVKAFLAEGANVVATDIQDALLQALPSAVPAEHADRLLPYNCDSSDEETVKKLVADAVAKFGRLDVFVNNAGVDDNLEPTGDCSRAMWDRNLRINLTAPFITCQNAVNQFLKQDLVNGSRGVILNVCSAAGMHGARAGVAYTAAKHGLAGLTKSTAAFYGPQGIRCLAIMPGPMHTDLAKKGEINVDKYHKGGLALASAAVSLTLGEPGKQGWNFGWSPLEQVAKTVMVLCSDGMNTVNGALVPTDMGWTAI